MSYFIAIDGISGSGKSTAIMGTHQALLAQGYRVNVFHDRLGEPTAATIDQVQHGLNLSPLARLYFMLAVRRQVIDGAILPSLERDDITIADRYYTSTVAYQAHGQGLDPVVVTTVAQQAAVGAEPSRFFIIDVPVELALQRMTERGGSIQVFDDEQEAFHHAVREGYLAQAKSDKRFVVIDGRQSREGVVASILEVIHHDLPLSKRQAAGISQ